MTDVKNTTIGKFNSKQATIGILGMGYVGLPLMLRYADIGYKVVGFDIDQSKINAVLGGKSYIEHIPEGDIQSAVEKGMDATTDFSRIVDADAIILCVPTPLNKYREPDLSYVIDTLEASLP
jgi:UDP-N-acetyl-D-glucosamine dehydrogenase